MDNQDQPKREAFIIPPGTGLAFIAFNHAETEELIYALSNALNGPVGKIPHLRALIDRMIARTGQAQRKLLAEIQASNGGHHGEPR